VTTSTPSATRGVSQQDSITSVLSSSRERALRLWHAEPHKIIVKCQHKKVRFAGVGAAGGGEGLAKASWGHG